MQYLVYMKCDKDMAKYVQRDFTKKMTLNTYNKNVICYSTFHKKLFTNGYIFTINNLSLYKFLNNTNKLINNKKILISHLHHNFIIINNIYKMIMII